MDTEFQQKGAQQGETGVKTQGLLKAKDNEATPPETHQSPALSGPTEHLQTVLNPPLTMSLWITNHLTFRQLWTPLVLLKPTSTWWLDSVTPFKRSKRRPHQLNNA